MSHNTQHGRGVLSSNGTETADSDDPDWLDEVFDLLSNSRRRLAIQTILEHESISKRKLTELVTAKQYDMDLENVSGTSERQTVNSSLHQTHLPRLESAEVIDRDETGSHITLGPRAEDLKEWMPETRLDGDGDSLTDRLRESFSALC